MLVEISLERVVEGRGFLGLGQAESDGEDKVTAFGLAGIKDGMAVRKVTVFCGDFYVFVEEGVISRDGGDDFGSFGAVGTDVLDGRGGDGARDVGQKLGARKTFLDSPGDKIVPRNSAANLDGERVFIFREDFEAHDLVVENHAWEAGVKSDGVGASAKEINGEIFVVCKIKSITDIICGFDTDIEISWAAEAHGGLF